MIRYGSALVLVYPGLVILGVVAGFLGLPWLLTSAMGMVVTAALWYAIMGQIAPGTGLRAKATMTWYLLRGRTSVSTGENVAGLRRLILASAFLPFCGHVVAGIFASDGSPGATGPDPNLVAIVGLAGFTLNCVIKLQEHYWDRFFNPWLHRREPLQRRIARAWRKAVYRLRKPDVFPDISSRHDYDWVGGRSPTLDRLARGTQGEPAADDPPSGDAGAKSAPDPSDGRETS